MNVLDLPLSQVREILARQYGVAAGRIDVVSGEIATVCRVAALPGPLAFKAIPATGDDARLVHWQTAAMIRLTSYGLPVPAVHLTLAGQPVHSGDGFVVQVTDWLTDPPLSSALANTQPPLVGLLRAVGSTAARVSLALDGLTPPVPVRHDWELVRAGTSIRAALDGVQDPHVVAAARQALTIFDRDLEPLFAQLPWSTVHHDLHDSNLLVGPDHDITGILDFGDLTYAPRLAELAVAAAYAARNTTDPRTALLEVATGWTSHLPLTPGEASGLLPAATCRLAANATIWDSRLSGPRAAYAQSRTGNTLKTLSALLAIDPAQFVRDLH